MKRGQAALEFLTTYAWAFILILIVVAAISYFGVLRPKQVLPDRCLFNVGFSCEAYAIDNPGDEIRLRLKNNVGQVITTTALSIKEEDGTAISCTTPPVNVVNWPVGGVQELIWTGCDDADFTAAGFVSGEKGKLLVDMTFNGPAGVEYAQRAEGEIIVTVQ